MEHTESNKENAQTPIDITKISSLLKAYLEAREELIKKYAVKLPEWKV